MKRSFAYLAFWMLILTACSAASAQEARLNLSGRLLSARTGMPVVGLRLSLVEPGEHFTTTDGGGQFIFRDIPQGTYQYLFAYERGDSQPVQTTLLKKQITLTALSNEPLKLTHEPLMERPLDMRPRVADLQFLDNRKREHYQAILIKEPLGLPWPEQYLSLNVGFPRGACRQPSLRVMDGATGSELPFQIINPVFAREDFLSSCTIIFPASLEPFQSKIYAVCADWQGRFEPPNYKLDLKAEYRENLKALEVSNDLCAIRIPPDTQGQPRTLEGPYPAPIITVRGPDGVWFGRGELISERLPASYSCEETESGPIFRQYTIIYKFDAVDAKKEEDRLGPAEYRILLRMYAKRDFISIREQMIGDIDLNFRLHLTEQFTAGFSLSSEDGHPHFNHINAQPTFDQPVMLAAIRAWNPPGVRRSHNWFGLAGAGNRKDAVGLVQVNGSTWEFKERAQWLQGTWISQVNDANEARVMMTPDAKLFIDLPHRTGTRELLLVLFDKNRNWDAASLSAPADAEGVTQKSHYLNRLHIAHSQLNPLKLKTVLSGGNNVTDRPRLLFNVSSYGAVKEAFEKHPDRFPAVMQDVFTGSRIHTSSIRRRIIEAVATLRSAMADHWNTRKIAGYSGLMADIRTLAPIINDAALLYDIHARSGLFSVLEKEFIEATFAAAAAQLADPNFEGTFAHDPGLKAHRDTALTVLALLLDKHPQRSARVLVARRRFETDLRLAQQAGGLSLNTGAFTAALNLWAQTDPCFRNASGLGDVGDSPVLAVDFRKSLSDLIRLTAPPDPRFRGLRLLPTLGQARGGDRESLAMMGLAAMAVARMDKELAAQCAWAWQQAGQPFYEGLSSYVGLLDARRTADPTEIEPKPPERIRSTLLDGMGVLLRSDFMTPNESYLLFKCSPFTYSHHKDQGSLLYYAFGTPVLVDTGAPPTRRAAWAHNTFRVNARPVIAPGKVLEFVSHDADDYTVGRFTVDGLPRHREYLPSEFKGIQNPSKPSMAPVGYRADGTETLDMLYPDEKLDPPVEITRHILFNRQHQYLVVLDRFKGYQPTDVSYNILAREGRLSGTSAEFAGAYDVDVKTHAFGSHSLSPKLFEDVPGRWVLHLSQPAPTAPPQAGSEDGEKEAELPVVEYLTVICPVKRGSTVPVPQVEKIAGSSGVRITYGNTVRYIFLSDTEIEYKNDTVAFKGKRGILTVRPTHFDVALFDAGEMLYRGAGVRTDAGTVAFRIAPNGYIDGEVRGPKPKWLTFLGIGLSPRNLSYRINGQEYIGKGNANEARYAVTHGLNSVNITPK